MAAPDREGDTSVVTRTRTEKKLERPTLYKVLLHNDDYTTREFVVVDPRGRCSTAARPTRCRSCCTSTTTGSASRASITFEVAETKVEKVDGPGRAARVSAAALRSNPRNEAHPSSHRTDLQASLRRAFEEARKRRHEYVTLEHLLLALLDDPDVARMLASLRRRPRRAARASCERVPRRGARDAAERRRRAARADARRPARAAARRDARA